LRKALGVIPVRFGSKRFPGKPLAVIQGKPMVQWVYEGASRAALLTKLIVATDDDRILQAARGFGAEACLTSPRHASGTERAAEVAAAHDIPIVVNIQGDEPLMRGADIDRLIEALQDPDLPMATLAYPNEDLARLNDADTVKVVIDAQGYALYFSRSPLPYRARDFIWEHVGIYGYQRDFLLGFPNLPPSRLEGTENLEQLRALENGHRIKVLETPHPSLSVDTPDDIIRVEERMKQ
jgi:3-deoxy-manno-octulosonate cytidylyltransferase (CMP-KDO synthetase)